VALHPRVLHGVTANGKLPRATVSIIGPKRSLPQHHCHEPPFNGAGLTMRMLATSVFPSDNQRVRFLVHGLWPVRA